MHRDDSRYSAVHPPSTTSPWPVIARDSSEARKSAAFGDILGVGHELLAWHAQRRHPPPDLVDRRVLAERIAGGRVRRAREQRVDVDAARPVLHGERADEADHRGLRRAVGGEAGHADEAEVRGDQHDLPVALRDEVLQRRACAEECAAHVDRELPVEVLQRELARVSTREGSGRVGDDVQIAVGLDRPGDDPVDGVRVGHVELDVLADASSLTDQLVRRLGAFVRLARPRRDHHGRSFGSVPQSDRSADAGGAADDEGHLAVQPSRPTRRTAIAAISWR